MAEVKGRSLWQDALRRLLRNKAARGLDGRAGADRAGRDLRPAGSAPHRLRRGLLGPDRHAAGLSPTGFWFGTDDNGRDLFVRALYGARVSLAVGVAATLVSLVDRRRLRRRGRASSAARSTSVMMRFVDILYSLPFMFFVIILMVVFGRNIILMFVALGAVEWLTMARIVRGQTLSVKRKEFIEAAHAARRLGPGAIIAAPHHPQRAGAGGRLRHAHRARGDHDRELPLLPGPRRAGALHLAGAC